MSKSPALAAVLNFLTFGGGTLYVGKRPLVGALLCVGSVAQAAEIYVSPPVTNAIPTVWPFLIGGLVVLKIGLAVDAWPEAQEVNAGR